MAIDFRQFFSRYVHIAPLAVLRIAFGAVMFISTLRFIAKGWIRNFYVVPRFHFPFYGFGWIKVLPPTYMYILYGTMLCAALFMMLGFFYRISSTAFFISFCYAELIDKTYYLNHYYLVSVFTFLMILVPAHRYFSLDVLRKPELQITEVPAWTIGIFKFQLCLIYFFAGLSKLSWDWLFNAMPLRIWLPPNQFIPVVGPFLKHVWVAYFFSWAGALFDLSIGFLLLSKHTRIGAYCVVIIFHILTACIFQIGMFPYIMVAVTMVFFPPAFHQRLIGFFQRKKGLDKRFGLQPVNKQLVYVVLSVYFIIQFILPLRYLVYPGTLLWTEEGYRFSWRVMLMEKGGTSFFYVKNPATGRRFEVNNSDFLTLYQERMMETQPDMMLQYAHILKSEFQKQGIGDPQVTVESYVSLNGSGSRLYIDSSVNLANEKETLFGHKKWILPYK